MKFKTLFGAWDAYLNIAVDLLTTKSNTKQNENNKEISTIK